MPSDNKQVLSEIDEGLFHNLCGYLLIEANQAKTLNFISHSKTDLKRLLAILLLCLFAFNWFGYRLVSSYLENRADVALQVKLDKNSYDPSRLFEVKIPLNLPYSPSWSSYEQYQGQVELNGVHYNYVKRKVVNDTLILVCIINESKNQVKSAGDEYFKNVNDLQNTGNKKSNSKENSSKAPVSDYQLKENTLMGSATIGNVAHFTPYLDLIPSFAIMAKDRPPQA